MFERGSGQTPCRDATVCQDHGTASSEVSCPNTMLIPCVYHAYIMRISCLYHAYIMLIPCLNHAYIIKYIILILMKFVSPSFVTFWATFSGQVTVHHVYTVVSPHGFSAAVIFNSLPTNDAYVCHKLP